MCVCVCDYHEKCFMSEQLSIDSFGQMIDESSLGLFFVAVVFFLLGHWLQV